ncbi:hypothetical protein FHW96_002375 [Novosphingobium sp. SG751A]|uniref:hypothetical protein n=1 Tax=Novosphingobium sp. SG751A TaxID=2587000 RepID=UPI001555DFA8|nr:hypothetical protein [Novosphingobium sp. SG751A]NOW46217.1 hypothetical protein [Novosphingobium sp. SG751A]
MAKPLTASMRARLIAAYDHAGDLMREGYLPLSIIRSLQASHGAFYGYVTCTDKLRCAGVEITSNWKNHAGMLDAWMIKAAARLDEDRAIHNAPVSAGTHSIITREPINAPA